MDIVLLLVAEVQFLLLRNAAPKYPLRVESPFFPMSSLFLSAAVAKMSRKSNETLERAADKANTAAAEGGTHRIDT